MKERGIIFSAPMVRALLDGRKSQTRRVVKWPEWLPAQQIPDAVHAFSNGLPRCGLFEDGQPVRSFGCPYGQPGDRLWVRETWGYRGNGWTNLRPDEREYDIHYQADDSRRRFIFPDKQEPAGLPRQAQQREGQSRTNYDDALTRYWRQWRPSIFMPRWASRITLEVTGVRVERLQDISEEDAFAEGVEATEFPDPYRDSFAISTPGRAGYAQLWNSINGPDSWDANPWVWCIEFQRLEAKERAA